MKSKAAGKLNYTKLLIISMAYIAVSLSTQGFKAILTLVRADLGITSAQAGLYSTFFFLSATVIAVFSGRVVDSLGSKKSLVIGTFIVGSLMVLHSFAPSLLILLILAFFTGIGFSIITPAVNKGVMEIAPPQRRASALGISQAGSGIGGVLGASLLPILGQLYGWQTAILIAGIVAVGFSLMLIVLYNPPKVDVKSKAEVNFKEDMKLLLKNKGLLCVAMMGFLFGFTLATTTTHLVIFLDQDIGFTPGLAGIALAIFQMGGIFGKPSWGYINDTILNGNRRKGFLIIGLLSALCTLMMGSLVPAGYITGLGVYTLVFFFGATSMGIPGLFFTAVGDIVSDKLMGTATGISLVFIRVGVIIGPPLFGLIADINGNYSVSWLFLSVILVAVTLCFYYLSGKYLPKSTVNNINVSSSG
ncbi:MFS transporter [Proteinivorax tanatarense]|uniref:MFS transporter n=1 Tax=Proteinivorax tanatarense TaxID=1260629 RepID=A0AAU7VNI2_9FIRM